MGTNCAPTWANLVLRFYERVRPLTDMLLFRFTDDGLVLHHPEVDEKQFLERLQRPYPSHLRVKPVPTPAAIFGSLGVCIYVPASRHWLTSYSPIHLT